MIRSADFAEHFASLLARFNFGDRPDSNTPIMLHAGAMKPASCARYAEMVWKLSLRG
jgi:hypothetical protein